MTEKTTTEPAPLYIVNDGRPRRIKRVKLALFLSSMAACFGVSIVGFIMLALIELVFGVQSFGGSPMGQTDFLGGILLAFQYSALNFFLLVITIPAAALVLGFSIARFPGRGIAKLTPYLRWGAIWGAVLVGGVTGGLSLLLGIASVAGALLGGAFVGTTAGVFCGFLFQANVRPARQIAEADVGVF